MKPGFAALARRVAKLEADAPRSDGLILVEAGMRGLVEAMAQVVELRERGLLPEPEPNAPPTPMTRLRDAVVAEERRLAEIAPAALPAPSITNPLEAAKEIGPCTEAARL
jgi:hypothetical protein